MEMPRRPLLSSGGGVRFAAGGDEDASSASRYEQVQRNVSDSASAQGSRRGRGNEEKVDDFTNRKHAARAQEEDQLLLHQTVMASRKQQVELQRERLAKQRAFIRHEKRRLLLQNALLEAERERFDASLASDWFCSSAFPSGHDRRVTIDVGGQLFEISRAVASKDSGSLLAAFVGDESPLSAMERGCFRIDRDWWLFRYVLRFLRDGILPQDPKLLRELYLESEFWKLDSLRKAIEMRNMELLQTKQESEAAAASLLAATPGSARIGTKTKPGAEGAAAVEKTAAATNPTAWWLDPPIWWGSGTSDSKPEKSDEPPAKKVSAFASVLKRAQTSKATEGDSSGYDENDAWWKSTTYKGIDFVQALSPEKKNKQQRGGERHEEDDAASSKTTPRAPLIVNTTWPSSHHLQG